MFYHLFLILLSLAAVLLAGPVKNFKVLAQTSCAIQCTEKSKFGYKIGETYRFTYEGETKTSINGGNKEQSGLKFTATALVEVLSKCELALKIEDAVLSGSDPNYYKRLLTDTQSNEFKTALEQHPLRFSFQDGIMEELCPLPEESAWVLNIKKGILSSLQNTMDTFKTEQNLVETDVAGKCRTKYNLKQEEWRSVSIVKSKDINTCVNRHGFDTSMGYILNEVPSSLQSLPIMNSSHECEQKISKDGHMYSVLCHEVHLFKPFSQGDSGAMTEVTQKLAFVSKSTGTTTKMAEVSRRDTLLFTQVHGEKAITTSKKQVQDKLKALCLTTENGIRPETPDLFAQLVMLMKKLDATSMAEIFEDVKATSYCPNNMQRTKKFYMDAIPMVGTGAAVRQITQLIMNNDVTGALTESWLVSLSFIQHPTKDMLTEIAKMMNTVHGTKILLPMSTLMHTYCQKQSCEQDSDISDILNKMTANLGNDCNGANEEKVILTLRAIGNIEQTQTMIPVLEKCFSRKNNAMGIRVAAVEAYRRMPCAADRNNLIALFRNTDEDSELRLAAYLQVMKCPTDNILQQIKETLMSEEVNQVGSFVWTHLMNLRESSSPYKETVKTMLESDDLPKKFDLDQRKFSRNYEWSHYSQELNMGGMLDSNLIWSPESFVPRSVSANLSVELFGHSVNLLEIGGRAEGLDYLLESYFGPSGYFKDGTINPDEKDCSDIKMKKLEKVDRNFDKKVQELKGAMYARVFGNEVLYNQLGQSAPKASGSSFNFLEMYQELAKGNEISYTKSNMFLDSSLIVPTIIGLPLNLTVNGTVSVDLKGRATIDLTKPHKKILIDGIIEPSGAVEFASMMSVDAYFTKSGIKMTSTLHSSTGVSTKIEIKNKQEYVFNFDVPKTKSEIVTARSELFLVFKDQEKKQVPASEDITTRKFCSGHTIVQLTGLELCGDMMYPVSKDNALGFPLSGPAHSVVLLHKRDSHKGYQLEINQIDNKKLLHFKVFYDTPGSSTERATGFELEVNKDTKILKSSLISPWKKARFTGSLVDGQKEKKLSGLATVDETQEYRFDSSVGINTKGSQTKYKPKVVISYPNAALLSLDGSVDVVNSKQKQTLDSVVVLKGIQDDPITINVDIKNTPKAKGVTLKYTYEKKKEYSAEILAKLSDTKNKMIAYPKLYIKTPTKDLINVKGSISGKPGSNIRVVITEDKLFRTPISVKGDVKKIERGKRVFYKIRANYKGPQKTTARVRLNTDKKFKSFGCKMIGDYNFVRIFKWAKDKFEYSSKILNKSTRRLTSIEVKSDFKSSRYSTYNNLLQLKSVHRFNQVVEIKSSFDYGRTYTSKVNKQRATVNGIAKYNFKKNGASINYNVSIGYQPADLDASITGTHSHTQKNVKSNFAIRYEDKNKVTASLRLNDETKKIPKYSGKATLSYPGRDIEIEATGSRKTDSMGDIKLVIQHQKGAKSIVAGEFNQKSNTSVEFASNLKIYNQKPVSLNVATDISLANPKLDMTVVYDNDQYAVMASGEYQQQKYGKIMSHVQYLLRKVAVEVEGGDKEGQYIGKVDVSWDAIRNADKRVLLQSVARVNSWKDFRVISNLEYPGQKIAGELENLIKERYSYKTSGSVSWIPNQWVFAEVKLMDNRKKYRGATEASVSIQTSFQNFEEINVKVGNSYTKHEYEVQAGVTWSKGQTVSVTATSKYPPMIQDLNLDIKMTTPVEAFGNPHVILINKLSSSQKSHSASLQVDWGQKQFVHIETNGENIAYELQKREFTRNIGFSSSILNYEKVIFNITHAENLEKFRSEAAITHNNDKYLYTITMDHKFTGWQLDSRGTFDIKGPYDTMVLIWSHKNTDRDIRSTAEINWGKKQKFTAELTGDIQTVLNHKITSRFQMNVPSSSLRRVDAVFEHENKIGFIKTLAKINADKENIGTIDLNYGRQTSITNVDLQITSKYMDDFRLKSSVESANMPIKSSLEIQWKPYQKITGSFTHSDILNNIESKLTLTTPFPQARSIIIDASHKLNGLDWEAKGAVEYAPMQEITIGGIYNIHTTKKARVYITSPFPTMQRFETGVNFNGNWRKFSTDFDFEINPLVKKITASSEWNHDHLNTHGSVKLNTPFPQYPYMQAEIRRQNKVTSEETSFMIEYLPTQKIEVIGSYVAQPKTLQGTFTVKTPGNMPAVISYRQNGDSNAFVNHAENIYNEDQKVVLDTTFGIEPKVSGTFHMESPVKGYNTVDFQFSHEGKTWKDLRTQFLYGTNKERIEIETNFDIIGTIEAKAMIKTPFEVLKIAEASFSHDGTFPNLRTNIRGIFNNYSLESNLETSHSMRITGGKINLATTFPAVKFIELAINHEGSLDSFQTHIETTYNQKLIQADTVFSHSDDLTAFTSTLITPLQGWEKTMITFNRDGPLSNFKSTAEIKYQDKKIAASYDHSFKNGDVATTATLFTPYTNDIVFKLDQNQKKRGFTTNIEFTMGTDNEWRSRTNYKLRNNEFILDIDETLIMAGERYTGSFNIDHAGGVLLAFSTKVSGKLQSHSIGTDVEFNAQSLDYISASVKIDSSFKNYTEMDIAATHKLVQGKYKTGVKASLEKKHTVAVTSEVIVQIPKTGIKVDLQTSFSGYESASASIKTDRYSDGYKGAIQIVYPNGEKITADGTFKAELPVVDANIQVTTPYKGLESVVVKAKSSKSTADFEVRYGDSQKISGSMSHIIDLPTININWAVTTSMNTVSAEFNNKKWGNRYTTIILTNINGKKSSAKSMVSVDLPSIDMEVSIKDSPLKEFVDYDELPSDLTLVVRNQKSSKSTADFEVRYGDSQKISGSMSHIIDLPTININWAVTTSMNTVSAEFNNKKVGNRYTTTISTNINGKKSSAKSMVSVDLPSIDMEVSIKDSPLKEFVDYDELPSDLTLVVRNQKSSKSTADFEVRYGDSQKISGFMSHIIDLPTININWAVTTSMNTVSAEFNNKKVGNRYTTTISTNINGKKSSAKSMVSVDLPSIDMEVSIKDSPLKEFVDYDELPSDLTLVVRNQVGTPMIFTDIYLTVDSTENARIKSRINTDDMVGDIVITFLGEKLISISHNAEDKWTRTSNAALKWNDYNHMSTASRCMLNLPDIDCSVTVESTHHKDIQISVMNTVTDQLISSSASAFFGTALRYSGEMTLSPNPSDIQFTLKLLTPHENFTASEVSFTHIEKSKTYSTKLVVSSDKISTITLEGRNRLQTIFDLDLFGKITSDFEAIKLCQLRVTSRKEGDEYIMQVENIMNPRKRTIVDLSVVLPGENQPQSKMHLSIETPFDKLKSFKYKDDGTSNKNDKLMRSSRTVLIQYNGGTYLDIDEAADILVDEDWLLDYKLTFRHPRQMEYSFNSKKENNLFTGESIINWNKADINSNFQVKGQASIVNDKDLHNQVQLEAIHATRTVGIDAILQKTSNTKRSKFIVTWDKDNSKKAGFDLHQDNNKYSTKVVTPTRSIELVNEYDDSAPKVWSENTLYWDADMDTDKKAGIRLTCSSGERNHDHKIDIKLPTFNKEYTISTSTRQTSKLFESTVEFSYSPKRNRNIVMSVRLDDKSTGPQSSNYSWAIGMSQRYSNLDMTLSGHLGQSDDIDTVGANIQYLTNQRKTENLNIFMEIKKLQRKIGLYMHDPKGKSMGIIGRVESTSPLLVTVGCLNEGRHSENLIVKVDENKRSVEIKAKYDSENPNSALHMKAELPTKKDLQVELYRTGNFEQVTESLINIQLKDSRILHGKINWRPEMFADAMEFTAKRMMKDATEANAALLEVGTEIADELAGKDSKFSKELMDEIQPFAEALAKEIDNFQDELKIFKQKPTEMKRDNDLYLGDMSQFFNNCTQEFIVQYEKALRSMQTTYSDLKTKAIELSNDIKTYPFEKEYTKIVNELSSKFEEYKTEVHSMMMKEVDTMTASIKANIRMLQRKIKELLQKTKAIASEKLDLILQHPDIIKMQQQISQRLPVMPEYSMVVKNVKSAVKNVDPMKPYNDVVTKVTSVVQSKYEELNQDKDFVKFKILITEIYEELSTGFEFLSIKKQLMDIATQMHSDIKKFIVEDIAEMKILGLDKSRVIAFDPENGNIEVEIYMPTGMETLDRLPKIPVTKFRNVMKDFAGKVQTVIPDSDFNLWDIYYRVRPASLHPIDWIPPFKGYAYVAGNRHFITFDRKKFDFSGDCSFVLTRDLVDNNFTVIMNYKPNENIMDNLLVLAEGKTIEIFPDFTVKIDGKPHEFPYMSHKLSLERVGNWIKLDTGRGLIITGDLPSNVFTIEVSGWYFGKLAGILGTYNNEQYDELTTGDNKIVKNEDSFYNSWEVSKKCRPNGNNAVDIIQDESDFKYIKCAEVLKSTDSVLRPCFRQVNPDKAFEMCLNRDDMCAASRFYLHQCRQQGVYLPPPKECVQCVAPNAESFEAGETIRISSRSDDYQPISSADTIFIVEEKPCNKETTKHLGSLVYEVEQELTKAGISNNKYGLIGFNKKGSHSHTMDGQLLNDATNFVKGVESLTFTSYKTDTLDAILQAANYPFRAGVVKNIILLQCGGCSDLKTIQYQQVRHTLQARNIQFHILRDQEFMLGNKIPKQKILGIDSRRKYVLQNSNDQSRENMGYSVDTCSHLALLSNGSIFDSSSLSLKKVRHQKMAIDTISNCIAKSSLPSQCQVCTCEADETGAAKSVCRSCYSEMTDYISLWWNTFRHPMTIEQEINKQFQEFLNAKKGWAVLTA